MTLRQALVFMLAAQATAFSTSGSAGLFMPLRGAVGTMEQRMPQLQPWSCEGSDALPSRVGLLRMSSKSYNVALPRPSIVEELPDVCPTEVPKDSCPLDLVPAHCFGNLGLAKDEVETSSSDTAAAETRGTQSTTRAEGAGDEGCSWVEGAEMLTAEVRIAGLRGQPAGCLAVHLQTSRDAERRGHGTVTVTAFGRCHQRYLVSTSAQDWVRSGSVVSARRTTVANCHCLHP